MNWAWSLKPQRNASSPIDRWQCGSRSWRCTTVRRCLLPTCPSRRRAASSAPLGRYLAGRAQQHGLISRAMGDAIAFCPPLIISEQEMGLLLERFERALEDTAQWAK